MFGSDSKVGLYIDDQRVFAVEFGSRFGRVEILRSAQAEIKSASPGPPESQSIVQAVRQCLEIAGISNKTVLLALPAKESLVRYFEIPLFPKKERANAVRFEALKYIPFDIRDVFYDSKAVPDNRLKKLRVSFVAARRDNVNAALGIAAELGLKLQAIEPAPLSLARAILLQKQVKSDEVCALVDAHQDGVLSILIVKNGLLLMVRDSLFKKSVPEPDTAKSDFESFLTELRLSLNYFSKNFKNEEIQRLVLCTDVEGGFGGWDELLHRELNVPVEISEASKLVANTQYLSHGMAVVIGLALQGISSGPLDGINLLPNKEAVPTEEIAVSAYGETEKELLKQAFYTAIFLGALLAVLYFALDYWAATKREGLRQLKRMHSTTAYASGDWAMEQLAQKQNDLSERMRLLDVLMNKRIYWTTKMNEIARHASVGLRLFSIEYDKSIGKEALPALRLKMEGGVVSNDSGNDLERVNRLLASLKEDKDFMQGFTEVKLSSLNKTIKGDRLLTTFVVECLGSAAKNQ